jgi:hypothetical protein
MISPDIILNLYLWYLELHKLQVCHLSKVRKKCSKAQENNRIGSCIRAKNIIRILLLKSNFARHYHLMIKLNFYQKSFFFAKFS